MVLLLHISIVKTFTKKISQELHCSLCCLTSGLRRPSNVTTPTTRIPTRNSIDIAILLNQLPQHQIR
ncbi:hypothetical protein A2U01_0089976, partial [Trifolium medium]|nr:hypothetical protein [Trifolium medium]